MAKYEKRESFKHLMAKQLLVKWLRDIESKNDHCQLGDLSWRSNQGVHEELPFYETSNPYYFELSGGLNPERDFDLDKYDYSNLWLPNFNKGLILFVPDITIFHKGCATHLIEVVHKSDLTAEKINEIMFFFHGTECPYYQVWTISADHILGQVNQPTFLNFEKAFNPR